MRSRRRRRLPTPCPITVSLDPGRYYGAALSFANDWSAVGGGVTALLSDTEWLAARAEAESAAAADGNAAAAARFPQNVILFGGPATNTAAGGCPRRRANLVEAWSLKLEAISKSSLLSPSAGGGGVVGVCSRAGAHPAMVSSRPAHRPAHPLGTRIHRLRPGPKPATELHKKRPGDFSGARRGRFTEQLICWRWRWALSLLLLLCCWLFGLLVCWCGGGGVAELSVQRPWVRARLPRPSNDGRPTSRAGRHRRWDGRGRFRSRGGDVPGSALHHKLLAAANPRLRGGRDGSRSRQVAAAGRWARRSCRGWVLGQQLGVSSRRKLPALLSRLREDDSRDGGQILSKLFSRFVCTLMTEPATLALAMPATLLTCPPLTRN